MEVRTREIEISRKELEKEKIKSDGLLLNILPVKVADELKETSTSEARSLDGVTILFTDFVKFTKYAESMTPKELVSELHACFSAFDRLVEEYNVEKIKTIGDGYMAAGGMNGNAVESAANVVRLALEMQKFISQRKRNIQARSSSSFNMRVGINSGPVVAGIVGFKSSNMIFGVIQSILPQGWKAPESWIR